MWWMIQFYTKDLTTDGSIRWGFETCFGGELSGYHCIYGGWSKAYYAEPIKEKIWNITHDIMPNYMKDYMSDAF